MQSRQYMPSDTASIASTQQVYVIGIESSGTRWLARALFACFTAVTTLKSSPMSTAASWDGEYPPCVNSSHIQLMHVSLPWGGRCEPSVAPPIMTQTCTGLNRNPTRFILNALGVLTASTGAKLVVIRRHPDHVLKSVLGNHCNDRIRARKDIHTSSRLLKHAVDSYPERVFLLDYEYMDDGIQWSSLTKWLGVPSCTEPQFALN